jgi:hypothetical protein
MAEPEREVDGNDRIRYRSPYPRPSAYPRHTTLSTVGVVNLLRCVYYQRVRNLLKEATMIHLIVDLVLFHTIVVPEMVYRRRHR